MNLILRISRDNNRRRTLGLSATFAWCWVFPVTIVARGEFHCRTSVTVYESLLIYLCPHIEKKKGLGCFLFPKPCYMYQSLYHFVTIPYIHSFVQLLFSFFFFLLFHACLKKLGKAYIGYTVFCPIFLIAQRLYFVIWVVEWNAYINTKIFSSYMKPNSPFSALIKSLFGVCTNTWQFTAIAPRFILSVSQAFVLTHI